MHSMSQPSRILLFACAAVVGIFPAAVAVAQERSIADANNTPNLKVLSAGQWQQIDTAVDRGLEFIARHQQADGSFMTLKSGQPGVSSLCIMAFLSRGHVPGMGPYGDQLERAIEFVLSTQHASGVLSIESRGGGGRGRPNYNHAIAGLMLGEVYGMTTGDLSNRIREAIPPALKFSRMRQTHRKRNPRDHGGWRYVRPNGPNDSDLTATSWQLMFYRSAKNAEFDVPAAYIDDAMGYVRRCYEPQSGGFVYGLSLANDEHYASGGSVGGGIVALAMGGEHNTEMAQAGGRWILKHPFTHYNRRQQSDDRYHYSAYYCSQAMFQLGGKYWERFYPDLQKVLLTNQQADGSWDREARHDSQFGNIYTTALTVLALTPPYQLLPIYQR